MIHQPDSIRPTRRQVLTVMAGGLAATGLGVDRLAFAAGPKDRPLVLILLCGGPDSQALLPSYADPAYADLRSGLALPLPDEADGIADLNGLIGLHPAASVLVPFWSRGEMAVAPAIASPYRGRSHFEAQNFLESGMADYDTGASSGWLNRAIMAAGGETMAVALGKSLPLLLQGPEPTTPWSPAWLPELGPGFIAKVSTLYAADPLFAQTLQSALQAREAMTAALDEEDRMTDAMGSRAQDMVFIAELAGRALATESGPGVAVIEVGGWDTHQNQGSLEGPLARRIAGLSDGIVTLSEALGDAWDRSLIIVIGEFGRTVRPNGTRGTDHGTGGAALLFGGALEQAAVLGEPPSLDAGSLYEGRDIDPTLDSRVLFKTALAEHWGLSASVLDKQVFPGSGALTPVEGL